jgi:hypothetical protein
MFSPSAASDRMRKGISTARNRYSDASAGTTTAATTSSATMKKRSCAIGKICASLR